MNFFALIKL